MRWFNFNETSSWRAVVWTVFFVAGLGLILAGRSSDVPALMILSAPFFAGLGFAPDKTVNPK